MKTNNGFSTKTPKTNWLPGFNCLRLASGIPTCQFSRHGTKYRTRGKEPALLLSGLYRRLRNFTGSASIFYWSLVGFTTDRELMPQTHLTLPRRLFIFNCVDYTLPIITRQHFHHESAVNELFLKMVSDILLIIMFKTNSM